MVATDQEWTITTRIVALVVIQLLEGEPEEFGGNWIRRGKRGERRGLAFDGYAIGDSPVMRSRFFWSC